VMPEIAGAPTSPEELLELIRLDLPRFLNPHFAKLEPFSTVDARLWAQGRLGAAMHFDMMFVFNVEDGTVVLTYRDPRRWIFTTVTAPGDGEHPVSGHREWGIVPVGPSDWVIYTRGIDRPTGLLDAGMTPIVFGTANGLWDGFAQAVTAYVNNNNGVAQTIVPVATPETWNLLVATYGLSPR